MKTKLLPVIIFTIVSFSTKANALIQNPLTDTVCCTPDSLKIVSVNYPVFCVSWHVRSDSGCRLPYSYEVQWRYYPSTNPWNGAIVTYTGSTTLSFCARVDTCRTYQWRVRTICDTLNGGHYSDWVYGNKIGMNCPVSKTSENDLKQTAHAAEAADINRESRRVLKPKEK